SILRLPMRRFTMHRCSLSVSSRVLPSLRMRTKRRSTKLSKRLRLLRANSSTRLSPLPSHATAPSKRHERKPEWQNASVHFVMHSRKNDKTTSSSLGRVRSLLSGRIAHRRCLHVPPIRYDEALCLADGHASK